MLTFKKISQSNYECELTLDKLYLSNKELGIFDSKWEEFMSSDETNKYVLNRKRNKIYYPHKSWMPIAADNFKGRLPILILGGNPAPHSVLKDIYYAYEGKGSEHRFWKVLRDLGYWDLNGKDETIKNKFLNSEYKSKFRFGIEPIFTFPSTPSKPKWSGVMGLEKLFGKKYLSLIYEVEKKRLKEFIEPFFDNKGLIIAMQKDAYNAISSNNYNIQAAVQDSLRSSYNNIPIIGTPPTRWMYTMKMKQILKNALVFAGNL